MLTTIEFVVLLIAPFGPALACWLLNCTGPVLGAVDPEAGAEAGDPPVGLALALALAPPPALVLATGRAGEDAAAAASRSSCGGSIDLAELKSPDGADMAGALGIRRGGRRVEVEVGAEVEVEVDAVGAGGSEEDDELVEDEKYGDLRMGMRLG